MPLTAETAKRYETVRIDLLTFQLFGNPSPAGTPENSYRAKTKRVRDERNRP